MTDIVPLAQRPSHAQQHGDDENDGRCRRHIPLLQAVAQVFNCFAPFQLDLFELTLGLVHLDFQGASLLNDGAANHLAVTLFLGGGHQRLQLLVVASALILLVGVAAQASLA